MDPRLEDVWIWQPCTSGNYTTSSAYKFLHKPIMGPQLVTDWGMIWKLHVQEKVKVFIWLLLHDATQVNAHRFRCQLATSPRCTRCSHDMEDNLHALCDCPHAREVWLRCNAQSWSGFFESTVQAWVRTQIRGSHVALFLVVLWRQW